MKTEYRNFTKERLKHFRTANGVTPRHVANEIGMNVKTYGHYEEGISIPSVFTLQAICDLFKITLDEFMQGSPAKTNLTI